MTAARDWLAARSPAPPERLAARMRQMVDRTGRRDDLVDELGAAALACLRSALAATTRTDAALDLLAADGLLTYAWEAAAAGGPEVLERFAATYSPEHLATVLPEVA